MVDKSYKEFLVISYITTNHMHKGRPQKKSKLRDFDPEGREGSEKI